MTALFYASGKLLEMLPNKNPESVKTMVLDDEWSNLHCEFFVAYLEIAMSGVYNTDKVNKVITQAENSIYVEISHMITTVAELTE